MLNQKQKAAESRQRAREKREKERWGAFQKQCEENEAKGLTRAGYTKTFEGQSVTFYINNVKIVCTVDYEQSCPHLEFRGEPSALTETGYRSHFMQADLNQYESLMDAVADQVEYIIRNRYCQNSKAKYTLTWEPSLEYLKHSPEQLTLFGKEEAALC